MSDKTSHMPISLFSYIRAFYIKMQLILGRNSIKNTIKTIIAVPVLLFIIAVIVKTSERIDIGKKDKKTEQSQSVSTAKQTVTEVKPQEKVEEVRPLEPIQKENREQIFNEHIDKAVNYTNEGKYESALEEVNKAIATDFNNAIAYQLRGLVYYHMNMQNKALEDLTKSCNLGVKESCRYAEEVKGRMN